MNHNQRWYKLQIAKGQKKEGRRFKDNSVASENSKNNRKISEKIISNSCIDETFTHNGGANKRFTGNDNEDESLPKQTLM